MRYLVAFLVLTASSATARAEEDEWSVGVEAALCLQSYGTEAVEDVTWTAGVAGSWGLLDDLALTVGFAFSTYDAYGGAHSVSDGEYQHTGQLSASHTSYALRAGLRYKLLAGYPVAPHVEVGLGYLRSEFSDASLYRDDGEKINVTVKDFGQNGLLARAGLVLDYRLFDLVFIGVGAHYSFVLGDYFAHSFVEIPISVQVYWY